MDLLSAAVFVAIAAGAVCQVLSGVGFALVCTPFLVLLIGHNEGVQIVLFMSAVLNTTILLRAAKQVRVGDALRLLAPAALLVVPAVLLAETIRVPLVTLLAGAAIVTGTAIVLAGRTMSWLSGTKGAWIAGAASGIFNVLAAASGPPVALFAAQRQWTPPVARATMQAFALPLNLITLIALRPDVRVIAELGWAFAGLALGSGCALLLTNRVAPRQVRRLTLAVAGAGGGTLMISGFANLL